MIICPHCDSTECLQVDAQKAECLRCTEVFVHPALDEEEEQVA